MTEIEQVRHAAERGAILRTLKQDYQSEMTSISTLIGALDLRGISLSREGIGFHLQYLADQGYIRIWRVKDMPGFRSDRRLPGWEKPEVMKFTKLLPKGLLLLDGNIQEDAKVTF
ncbi:MAG: hypothetical protein ABFD86_05090 [Bryobacteraceae bacterium]